MSAHIEVVQPPNQTLYLYVVMGKVYETIEAAQAESIKYGEVAE